MRQKENQPADVECSESEEEEASPAEESEHENNLLGLQGLSRDLFERAKICERAKSQKELDILNNRE
jgi:hypothetical protein